MARINMKNEGYSFILLPLKDDFSSIDCLLTVDVRFCNQQFFRIIKLKIHPFLSSKEQDFVLHLSLPDYPNHKHGTFHLDYSLRTILTSKKDFSLDDEFKKSESIHELIEKIGCVVVSYSRAIALCYSLNYNVKHF